MNVHQVLSGVGPHDAVSMQCVAFRELFKGWGWGGGDHAVDIDPRMGSQVKPLKQLQPGPGDILLLHYSAYAPKLQRVLDFPQRKLLISHNITPASWFWDYDPTAGVVCALGRKQLPEFASRVDTAAGVSLYNARELGGDTVIPILFDPAPLGIPGPPDPPGPPTVLFVGRLTPHKRQDEVIRAFTLYKRRHAPDARLVLIGSPLNTHFEASLKGLAEELEPGAVEFASGLSREELAAKWRSAHVFLCLSEHEGFCIPVLEAMHFGVPVISRAIGGIPEVGGDAALFLDEDDDVSVAAELVHLAVSDAELRAELQRRGRARVEAFAPAPTAAKLKAAVEALASR